MSGWIAMLGGLGLFLYGMAAMTSGLRKLAGDRLRQWLGRSTRTPLSGAVTGAAVTALIQSSSATTVAAVGFVGAGLITFAQSLGIILGANIGTTITGWMVALLGFKLQLSTIALPLLFVAAVCYLFKGNRLLRGLGKALAGFSLIFLGIGYLQEGLAEYRDAIDLSRWTATDWTGRLLLVGVGIVLTLITQSSSATVATALTAVHATVIDLPQAMAVVIGADIGTTTTAALATVGASTASRRTGFAHVIYNLLAGTGAFFALPAFLRLVEHYQPGLAGASPEVVTVLFHSGFNTAGVALVLPLARPFARLLEWLFPEKAPPLAKAFIPRLLEDPHAAVDALVSGSHRISVAMLDLAAAALTPARQFFSGSTLAEVKAAAAVARDYALDVASRTAGDTAEADRVFECVHLIDHTERLAERATDTAMSVSVQARPELAALAGRVAGHLTTLARHLESGPAPDEVDQALEVLAGDLENDKSRFRRHLITDSARGDTRGEALDHLLDAHRWVRRLAYHAWRIARHSRGAARMESSPAGEPVPQTAGA